MRLSAFIFAAVQLLCLSVKGQVYGCMDPRCSNYNPLATVSDGSCIYPEGSVALKNLRKAVLPNTVSEISGIIYFDGKLYGHNDSGGQPAIYEIDTANGNITKTITLQGAANTDWEDITQNDSYVYIGDIGNNDKGNRTDLKIYRIPKSDIKNIAGPSGMVTSDDIEVINFRYEDQADLSPVAPNTTRYDCEAMICDNGKLHLFTKNWTGNYTVHYVLDAAPSPQVQVAIRKDSMNTGGVLITGAARVNYETTALLGYQVTGFPSGFLWVISGYSDMNGIFTSGNKQKINLGPIVDGVNTGIGQVEGIAVADAGRVFISSEYFSRTVGSLTFTIQQSLYDLDIAPWLPAYIVLSRGITNLSALPDDDNIVITWRSDTEDVDHFDIESSNDAEHFSLAGTVSNHTGSDLYKFTDHTPRLSASVFYRIKTIMKNSSFSYSKTISVNSHPEKQFNLTVFPSPFSQALRLSVYSDKNRQVELNCFDLYGRKIFAKQWNCIRGDNQTIWRHLPFLNRSVYFITARSEGDLIVKKIMTH